jgi:hypothetical protein
MQKNYFFSSYFLLTTYPQAHYLQSLIYFFKDKFVSKFYFASIISVRPTLLWEKGRIPTLAESKNSFLSTLFSAGPPRNRPAAIASPLLSDRDEQPSRSRTEIRESWRLDLANAKEQARQLSNFAEQAKNDIKTRLRLVRASNNENILNIYLNATTLADGFILVLFCVHFFHSDDLKGTEANKVIKNSFNKFNNSPQSFLSSGMKKMHTKKY